MGSCFMGASSVAPTSSKQTSRRSSVEYPRSKLGCPTAHADHLKRVGGLQNSFVVRALVGPRCSGRLPSRNFAPQWSTSRATAEEKEKEEDRSLSGEIPQRKHLKADPPDTPELLMKPIGPATKGPKLAGLVPEVWRRRLIGK